MIKPFVDPFPALIAPVLAIEGGYVDDPADSGGTTAFGVTEAVARAAGYNGDMRDLTQDQAIAVYRQRYWTEPGFDKLYALFPALAELMLNIGINIGPETISQFLQHALNTLSEASLREDGVCGPVTRRALAAYQAARGDDGLAVLLGTVRALAVCHYVTLDNARFEYGWIRRALLS